VKSNSTSLQIRIQITVGFAVFQEGRALLNIAAKKCIPGGQVHSHLAEPLRKCAACSAVILSDLLE
jgi:hypothetical protein